MENQLILVDTSILIEYYRKKNKSKTVLIQLLNKGYKFAISVVSKYEIYSGATENQISFWNSIFEMIAIYSLDEKAIDYALATNTLLKKSRNQIEIADLFIAATALSYKIPLATLNRKHFDRVESLKLVQIQ